MQLGSGLDVSRLVLGCQRLVARFRQHLKLPAPKGFYGNFGNALSSISVPRQLGSHNNSNDTVVLGAFGEMVAFTSRLRRVTTLDAFFLECWLYQTTVSSGRLGTAGLSAVGTTFLSSSLYGDQAQLDGYFFGATLPQKLACIHLKDALAWQ